MQDSGAKKNAKKAMKRCVRAIYREAKHHRFEIRKGLLIELQRRFENRFYEMFAEDSGIWEKMGETVERMARYLGAVAALNADSAQAKAITKEHLFDAARHIKEKCPAAAKRRGAAHFLKAACDGVDLQD
jgi:hypothetical protein